MKKLWIACSLLTLSLHALASSQPRAPRAEALPAAAQSALSARIGSDSSQYLVQTISGVLQTANQAGNLHFSFTRSGVETFTPGAHWQLQLNSYGYATGLKPVIAASPEAQRNRVEYQRGPITEWYANGPFGLEQGFTIRDRPAAPTQASQPLTLTLTLSGDMSATIADNALILTRGGERIQYTGLTAYDADGKELHSWLELHDNQLSIHVADKDARYPLVVDPFINNAILTSSDNAYAYGLSVSISGGTIVAGSQTAAYVYVKPASGWTSATQLARLTASDGTSLADVSISGNTIVAGAGFGNNQGSSTGEGLVFVKPATGWVDATETAVLTASDGTSASNLGSSVSINGNVIAVGANESNSVGSHFPPPDSGAGAVYVYVKPAGGWVSTTETAKLTSSDGVSGDNLGFSVAVGKGVIAAGAPNHDVNGGFVTGASYVFVEPAGGWASETEAAELSVLNEGNAISMGYSIAISGNTVLAGGYGGSWIYVQPSTGWTSMTQTATLTDSAPLVGPMGLSVSICNNIAVVGGRSMVDVYVEPTGGWTNMTQTWRLPPPNRKLDGNYGNGVAIQGLTIVIGFPQEGETEGNEVFVWGPA